MNALIVHAHPEPLSFNGALTLLAAETFSSRGHEVIICDLYQMEFNPVSGRRNFSGRRNAQFFKQHAEELHANEHGGFAPDVQREMEKVFAADLLILQFPLWWCSMPAILKGWIDRVFAFGTTYDMERWFDEGMFRGKRAMLSVTTGRPRSMYAPNGLAGDIEILLHPIQYGILRLVGYDVLPPHVAYAADSTTDDERQAMLEAYRDRLLKLDELEPIAYPPLEGFDENFRLRPGQVDHRPIRGDVPAP